MCVSEGPWLFFSVDKTRQIFRGKVGTLTREVIRAIFSWLTATFSQLLINNYLTAHLIQTDAFR